MTTSTPAPATGRLASPSQTSPRNGYRRLAAMALLFALAFLGFGVAQSDAAGARGTVKIKGRAYAFDNQVPIAGATIRAIGAPGVSTTSRADGSYGLTVPDGAKVTPYIRAAGYHKIFLQTFLTQNRDLRKVNFQVPSDGIYMALAALLDVKLDANGNPARCAIVSTVSTKKIRDLTFPEFVAFGAHGVPGAAATTSPRLPDPVYFNSSVIPDPSLSETSKDGGVIWTEVPHGTYRVSADRPNKRFASFQATCKNGRVVNANPPWGLYQLKAGEK